MNDIDNDWYYEPEDLPEEFDEWYILDNIYYEDPYENEPCPLDPQDTEGIEDL